MLQNVADVKLVSTAHTRRATRFELRVPVRYRLKGEKLWHSGKTENVSGTGLLLRGQSALRLGTFLELCLALPTMDMDEAPELICHGIVVRSARDADENSQTLAVRIQYSRLTRG